MKIPDHIKNKKQYLTLEASAGSGKTFALTVRYLSLLFLGVNAGEILTLTFTKKATGEMQERIISALDALVHFDGSINTFGKNILDSLCRDYGFEQEEVLAKAKEVQERFITQSPQIKTIDAFLSFIVRKFCWYMGISSSYEIREIDLNKVYEFFLQALPRDEYEALLTHLSLVQTSLYKITYLSSFEELIGAGLLEFIRNELRIDCSSLKDLDLKEIDNKISSISEALKKELLESIARLKERIELDIKASDSAKKLIKLDVGVDRLLESGWMLKGPEHNYIKKLNLQSEFEEIYNLVTSYLKVMEAIDFIGIKRICRDYNHALEMYYKKEKILNFADIEKKTHQLLNNLEDANFFYFRLDSRISHILVDEFQDTSLRQYEILKPLIDEIRGGWGTKEYQSLFFVGDPKQSIYRFRGADYRVFERILSITTKENLPNNYRSSQVVVDFNNNYFSKVFGDEYYPQSLPASFIGSGGYVKVYEPSNKESDGVPEAFVYVAQSLEMLFAHEVLQDKITILCYDNQTINDLKNYLISYFLEKNKSIDIITDASKKLGEMPEVKILSTCLKYAYTEDEKSRIYYEKCALKLLGKKLQDKLEMPPKTENLSEYLWSLMRYFGLCDDFAKMMLEVSFKHYDIEAFLDELAHMSITQEKETSLEGIRIMTIHASKGLEFDHVIFCDRVRRLPSDSAPILSNDSRAFYKKKKAIHNLRLKLDNQYNDAFNRHKAQALREQNNLLYVAFTRAKDSLFIIPSHSFDEEGELLLPQAQEIGEIKIHEMPKNSNKKQEIIPIIQQDYGHQKQDYVIENHGVKTQNALFGEALHLCMEYSWFLDNETLRDKIGNYYGFYLEDGQLDKILVRKDRLYEQISDFKDRGEIRSEVPIFLDNRLYRLDLMIVDDINKQIIILDYKSGGELEEHEIQLREYIDVIERILPSYKIEGKIAYVWDRPMIKTLE